MSTPTTTTRPQTGPTAVPDAVWVPRRDVVDRGRRYRVPAAFGAAGLVVGSALGGGTVAIVHHVQAGQQAPLVPGTGLAT
ncbi:hypothetical protein [Angustibacter aerolatus]|uniref:Uncharacterized protein n=1 Tax=Angustibacter aerolatus TaxID=1162965 RepID=A0ABQ6JCP0_9ACTN|nr:hypothetical protein GCM10025868_11830 [Angustibacter aerolatus]